MLEGVAIVGDVIIIVVRIGEERVAGGEDIARREVGCRQLGFLWILDHEKALVIVGQILTELVSQVGIRISVADDLDGLCTADTAMVGSYDDGAVGGGDELEEFRNHRMAEP